MKLSTFRLVCCPEKQASWWKDIQGLDSTGFPFCGNGRIKLSASLRLMADSAWHPHMGNQLYLFQHPATPREPVTVLTPVLETLNVPQASPVMGPVGTASRVYVV